MTADGLDGDGREARDADESRAMGMFFFFFYYFLPTVYLLLDYMYGKHDERLWIPTPRHVTTTSTYYGHDERRLGARDACYEYVCFFLVSYFFFFRLTE